LFLKLIRGLYHAGKIRFCFGCSLQGDDPGTTTSAFVILVESSCVPSDPMRSEDPFRMILRGYYKACRKIPPVQDNQGGIRSSRQEAAPGWH